MVQELRSVWNLADSGIHHAMDMDMDMDHSDILRDKVVLTYVTPPSPRGDFFLTDHIQSNVRGDA